MLDISNKYNYSAVVQISAPNYYNDVFFYHYAATCSATIRIALHSTIGSATLILIVSILTINFVGTP